MRVSSEPKRSQDEHSVGRGAAPKSKLGQRSILIPLHPGLSVQAGDGRLSVANTDLGPFARAGWVPGGCWRGAAAQGGIPLAPVLQPEPAVPPAGAGKGFVRAGGGRETNRQPPPPSQHAKRLPYRPSVSTATEQRSWPRGSRDAGIPSTGDRREVGTRPGCSHAHPRLLRAARSSQGTHGVCFNERDSLF